MSRKELMELNTLANQCGYFFNYGFDDFDAPNVNNGYNCRHPNQEEYEKIKGKKIGKCYAFSCPMAYSADGLDCQQFCNDCEDCGNEECECDDDMMVVEFDDDGKIVPIV